jgi:hypothetical protein
VPKKRKGPKVKKEDSPDISKEMWINPNSSLRGQNGSRAWDHRHIGDPTSGARFLELADLALGLKKPEARKRRGMAGAHETEKTEPYSS